MKTYRITVYDHTPVVSPYGYNINVGGFGIRTRDMYIQADNVNVDITGVLVFYRNANMFSAIASGQWIDFDEVVDANEFSQEYY
jgi:hypothetical protein